jgi:spore germination protein GerM
VAQATVEQLLAGPGNYEMLLSSPIPEGTVLRNIRKEGNRVVVDLSEQFATATDRQQALDTLVLSLTELRNTQGQRIFDEVLVLVEGTPLSEFWGAEYAGPFARPLLNGKTNEAMAKASREGQRADVTSWERG